MILLVPTSPEVPKYHRPRLWPSLVMALAIGIAFLEVTPILNADTQYVESIDSLLAEKTVSEAQMETTAERYLRMRPLL